MEDRKTYFDRHAARWDEELGYAEKADKLAEVTRWFDITRGDRILDVGTGTGVLLPFLAEAIGPSGVLVAMDFSYPMLEKAKHCNLERRWVLVNATVAAMPFRSNLYDRVTCFSALPHFPDKTGALSEMVRVLRKGGWLFIAHLHSVEEMNAFHQKVGGAVGHDRLPSPHDMGSLMEGCGCHEFSFVNQPGKFLARARKIS